MICHQAIGMADPAIAGYNVSEGLEKQLAVGAPEVEFVWAKLFNPAPNNRITTSAIFWFIAKLKRNFSHGSTRTRVHRTYPKQSIKRVKFGSGLAIQ